MKRGDRERGEGDRMKGKHGKEGKMGKGRGKRGIARGVEWKSPVFSWSLP